MRAAGLSIFVGALITEAVFLALVWVMRLFFTTGVTVQSYVFAAGWGALAGLIYWAAAALLSAVRKG